MIKIAFYSHVVDFAGTWRAHERIIEKVQHDKRFETFVLYASTIENNRLEIAKSILHKTKFLPFSRSQQKLGPDSGYTPVDSDIEQVVKDHSIDVIHFARSGYYEWPFNKRIAPVQIETNIFGYTDTSGFVDGTIFISKSFGFSENERTKLIATPVPGPTEGYEKLQDLRAELGIDKECLVFGRIGRPDNFVPLAYEAFEAISRQVNSKYLVIGGCENSKHAVKVLGIEDKVIFVDCTNSDEYIERFHKTIDIFAHYRSDGEICSSSLAHAMMYKIPIITHFAGRNGQHEWLGPGGFCVSSSQEYYRAMKFLSDPSVRTNVGENARHYALENFSQEKIAQQATDFYAKFANLIID